jgi:hypothetical protein
VLAHGERGNVVHSYLAQARQRKEKKLFIKSVIDKHKKHSGHWRMSIASANAGTVIDVPYRPRVCHRLRGALPMNLSPNSLSPACREGALT